MDAIVAQLDEDFARISEIYEEINAIRNGTFVPEEKEDWEEEYAEGYDEDEEMEVSIVVMEEDGEVVEEPAVIEEVKEEAPAEKSQEFDINID